MSEELDKDEVTPPEAAPAEEATETSEESGEDEEELEPDPENGGEE